MIESLLKKQLEPAVQRCRALKISLALSVCWVAAAVLCATIFMGLRVGNAHEAGVKALAVTVPISLIAALWCWRRARKWQPEYRNIARQIEQRHPSLHAVLLTAVEQTPDALTGQYGYLQERVIQEAVAQCHANSWVDSVPKHRLRLAQSAQWAALALFAAVAVSSLLLSPATTGKVFITSRASISPGDTSLERGTPLVVLARFEGRVPPEAVIVAQTHDGTQRIPLIRNLADPAFGATIPSVAGDLIYSIEYGAEATTNFHARVFDYPRLERADARIIFPAYTGKGEVAIKDTRRVSAVEGSRLDWTLYLNKPVASARLIARDQPPLKLAAQTNGATARLDSFDLRQTKSYQLQLVDFEGRTNKVPAQFILEALTNHRSEIKLAAPRGDQRVSALEEIAFQAETWDDFGISSYGLTYTVAGSKPISIELGTNVAETVKRSFNHLLKLEPLGLVPDQLVSWFVWADDVAPDGSVRRTSSDMFFAEVRPFDEIYRQGEGMEMDGQQGGGAGNESTKLAELQKQIINATWKLERQNGSSQYVKDAAVVHESQEKALDQAKNLRARAMDPRIQGLWQAVEDEMSKAANELAANTNVPASLPSALSAEQSAYQALLKISGREYLVARSRNRGGNVGGGEQRNQQQLDQLEFKGEDNRYETQRQAAPRQTAQQREQLGVLSRLKELAQRQQDLNSRLKELQVALQQAATEKEREEVRRELKRLREEEQEMLANMDELLQRMSQPENQSRMADSRRHLNKTRNDVQRASEALANDAVPEALTSGTRAERELAQLRDDFRKKNSSHFSDEMRQMRSEARDLARKQDEIGQQLKNMGDEKGKSLSDSDQSQATAKELNNQTRALTNLLDNVQHLSEQAEAPEPLLAKQLYDAFRRANQEDASRAKETLGDLSQRGALTRPLYDRLREIDQQSNPKSLDVAAELLRNNLSNQARDMEQRARADIQQLKRGVEKAAESVLGDDTEVLRAAQSELDQLARQLEREMAQAAAAATNDLGALASRRLSTNAVSTADGRQPGGRASSQPGSTQPSDNSSPQSASAGQTSSREAGQAGGDPDSQSSQDTKSGSRSRDGPFRLGQRAAQDFFNSNISGGGDGGAHDQASYGPLTGQDFFNWSERLGNVEAMVDSPELRSDITRIRDRARAMRSEIKHQLKAPQWQLVRSQLIGPLNEVRRRVAEELARRQSSDALVPIDRDPVPNKFSELVRRYYEKLGQD